MLQPQLPLEPHDFRGVFVTKYGEGARVPMWDRVIGLGEEVGIDFAFYRMTLGAHSIHGHRAVRFAEQYGRGRDMLERLYHAFYEQAQCVWRPEDLAQIGADLGLPAAAMQAYLASHEDVALIFALTEQYRQDPGVTGMPFHVVNGRAFTPDAGLAPWRALFEAAQRAAA
jgi:predicted DsbA family dithiol-disulfide isomerase